MGSRSLAGRFGAFYTRAGKRLVDLALSVPLAIATLPVVLIAGILLAVTSRRWPIERAPRMGQGGRHFFLYRLRTGDADNDVASHAPGRLAHLLSAWSLDELPQLWNVLLGTMSLVGPRPLTLAASTELEPWQRRRHDVKPGITGLWQVEARGDGRELLDNIHYDIQYIDQLSLASDLSLLFRRSHRSHATRRDRELCKPRTSEGTLPPYPLDRSGRPCMVLADRPTGTN